MKRILADGSVKNTKVKSSKVTTKKDHWTNESVRIVKSIPCYIPKYISSIMKALDKKFKSSEFSIFGIIDYNKNESQFELDEVYYIPKQKVSGASVNYHEDAPEGYNLVIHKHPRGCRNFSSTDDSYINQNFDYSILWEGGKFVSGQVRLNTEYGMLGLSLDIKEEEDELPTIPEDQLKKIEESSVVVVGGKYGGRYGSGHYSQYGNCWPGEDYNDYLYGGYGHGKNNQSLGANRKSKKNRKYKNVHKHQDKKFEEGSFLTKEQEEVNNYMEAQREELIEYLEEIDVIMAEKGISWEDAEEIYLEEHKDTIHQSLLDFNDPTLGTGLDLESEALREVE